MQELSSVFFLKINKGNQDQLQKNTTEVDWNTVNNWGKFNNASASKRSLYWCQALHITNKDRYQSTSARRALALLNSPLVTAISHQKKTRIVFYKSKQAKLTKIRKWR